MNELFSALADADARHTVLWSDADSGLRAVLVLDDVTLGPAAGGIRTQPYPSVRDAIRDASHLARNMTLKCALAGLDAGGGKVVVIDHANLHRGDAFRRLGERIEELGGLFRTGPDLGTTSADLAALNDTTRFVNRDDAFPDAVAQGLLGCLLACARFRGSEHLAGLQVAIQGCGAIGAAVARRLLVHDVKLWVADVNQARAERLASEVGARVCDAESILEAPVDILAPCAVGGVVTRPRAERVRAWAICGAANNILAEPSVTEVLWQRGILHVPDFVASAGAVVAGIGREVMGLGDVSALIDGLGHTALSVLQESAATSRTPLSVATARARARIESARASGPRRGSVAPLPGFTV